MPARVNRFPTIVHKEPAVTRSRPVAIPYVLAVLAYALLFGLWQVEPVPWQVHWASIFVAAIGFIPLARWYARGSQDLPIFELICLSYVLQFGTPVYLQSNQVLIFGRWLRLSWDGVFEALLLAALGLGLLIAGYYLVKSSPFAPNIPRLDLPLDATYRDRYIVLSIVVGLAFTLAQRMNLPFFRIGRLQAILGILVRQFNLAIILWAYQVYGEDKARTSSAVSMYIFVILATILGLASTVLEQALIPLVLLFAVRWHVTKKLPKGLLLLGIVLFTSFNAVKGDFRNQVYYEKTSAGIVERAELWMDMSSQLVEDIVQGDIWEKGQTTVRQASARLDLLHKFVWVRRLTPETVSYYNGASYSYFLYGWIPRLIWPDKPSPDINHRIDVDYRLLYPWQNATIAIGQLPEAYINFGIWGVAVVMLIQGMILGLLERWLNGPHSEGGRAIYLSLMIFFLNGIGSSLTMWFGAMLQNILASALIMRPFTTGWSTNRDANRASFSSEATLGHTDEQDPSFAHTGPGVSGRR